jgi:hypothetical protein
MRIRFGQNVHQFMSDDSSERSSERLRADAVPCSEDRRTEQGRNSLARDFDIGENRAIDRMRKGQRSALFRPVVQRIETAPAMEAKNDKIPGNRLKRLPVITPDKVISGVFQNSAGLTLHLRDSRAGTRRVELKHDRDRPRMQRRNKKRR